MKEYSIPLDFENLPSVMILEHEGKYYSFGRTCRTAESVWDEVKYKLDSLTECGFTEDDIKDLAKYEVIQE